MSRIWPPRGAPCTRRRAVGSEPLQNLIAVETSTAALEEVARDRVEFAVVPLETRAEGPVHATIDALTSSDLKIVATLEESFGLHLLNKTGNVGDVEKVYSTAADRALCAHFLESLGSSVSIVDVKSPFHACQLAVADNGAAALAAEVFGAVHALEVARRNVLDEDDHRVKYAIVGRRPASRTGNDVTSFVFSVDNAPGALLDDPQAVC